MTRPKARMERFDVIRLNKGWVASYRDGKYGYRDRQCATLMEALAWLLEIAGVQLLADKGIISHQESASRVIIDARASGPVRLYVERYGDERLLHLDLPRGIEVSTTEAV